MGNPAENPTNGKPPQQSLPERFWSLARGMEAEETAGSPPEPAAVVKHVLAVLDAFERGETSDHDVSLRTLSFLKLLREAELRGEVSYAAPEQIRGETVDERSLVFSVGVLLFERLTGRHPFGAEGNRPRRLARMQKGEFGSGVNYFPTVPPGLRRILMRAMGPFPEERWNTLKEMREHLEDFLAHEDAGVPLPGTAPSQPRKASASGRPRLPLKPASDSQPTRVVDMSERVKMEREALARRRARDEDSPAAEADAGTGLAAGLAEAVAQGKARIVSAPPPETTDKIAIGDAPDVRPRLFGSAAPLVWALIGAAVASLAFLLFLRPETPTPQASSQARADDRDTEASAAGETAAPASNEGAPGAESAPASDEGQSAAGGQPTAASAPGAGPAAPASAPANGTTPARPAAKFDPQLAGELALDAAWPCFDEASRRHGLMFGAGMLFDAKDGHVHKVYFAGSEELSAPQRSCFRQKMSGFALRTPPERNLVVDYQYRIHGEQRTVKTRGQ